mgnify:CR=1 FL=1
MKRVIVSLIYFLAAGFFSLSIAQNEGYSSDDWKKLVYGSRFSFFKTSEAARIAQNVLDYQRKTGGWPKNIAMHKPLTEEERMNILAEKEIYPELIQNHFTTQNILNKLFEIKENRNTALSSELKNIKNLFGEPGVIVNTVEIIKRTIENG